MISKTILACAAITLSIGIKAQSTTPNSKAKYHLVWQDEFDQDGTLNPTDRSYELGYVRNHEPQWYQPQNATCENGNLVITARKETVPNPYCNLSSKDWHYNRVAAPYTSASVTTKGKHELKYGRVEVRAKIPVSDGAWPAIWCLGRKHTTGEWPACGEVDILEFYSHKIWANTAWYATNGGSAWNSSPTPFTHFTHNDKDWTERYHVWRMDWDSLSIRIYLDNEKLNETDLTKTHQPIDEFCHVENPFHQPLYLILNLALRTTDHIDESKFPLKYYIDYVRFYELK